LCVHNFFALDQVADYSVEYIQKLDKMQLSSKEMNKNSALRTEDISLFFSTIFGSFDLAHDFWNVN